jgi:hypothetical protein
MLLGPVQTACLLRRLPHQSADVEALVWMDSDLPIDSIEIVFDLINHDSRVSYTYARETSGGVKTVDCSAMHAPSFIGSVFPNGMKERNLKGWKILTCLFESGSTAVSYLFKCPVDPDARRVMEDRLNEFMVLTDRVMNIDIKRVPDEQKLDPSSTAEFKLECFFLGFENVTRLTLVCQLV